MNPYAYAGNNPANAIDFDGKRIVVIFTQGYFGIIPIMSHTAIYMDRKNPDGSYKYKRIYDPNGTFSYKIKGEYGNRIDLRKERFGQYWDSLKYASLDKYRSYHRKKDKVAPITLEFNTTEKEESLIWKRALNTNTMYNGNFNCASGVTNALMKRHGLFKNLNIKGLGISYGHIGDQGFQERYISRIRPSTLYKALIRMNKHKKKPK